LINALIKCEGGRCPDRVSGFDQSVDQGRWPELRYRAEKSASLRDRLEQVLFQNVEGCYINGAGQPRMPNTTDLGFEGIDDDALAGMLNAAGIYVSTGSACSSDTVAPSHVVIAMTGSYERAGETIRFSLSHLNTDAEIDRTIGTTEDRWVKKLKR